MLSALKRALQQRAAVFYELLKNTLSLTVPVLIHAIYVEASSHSSAALRPSEQQRVPPIEREQAQGGHPQRSLPLCEILTQLKKQSSHDLPFNKASVEMEIKRKYFAPTITVVDT
jgi:hypothetical protein